MEIKKPQSCSIVLLTKCFFRCKMCEMWKSSDQAGDVSADEWKNFIASLVDMLDAPRELVFSGGEPLLHKDIFELIKFGADKGFKTLMPSNGYLIDEATAKRIADSGLREMFLSLDSTDYKVHDFLRGTDGAHAKVLKALDNLQRYCPDLRVGIITVVSGVNYQGIVEVVQWVKKTKVLSGVYFQAIAKPFFVPLADTWHTDNRYEFLWPRDTAGIHSVLDTVIQLRHEGYPIHNFPLQFEIFKTYFANPAKRARIAACYLGDYVINSNPQGDISLCCFMEALGNIKKDDIRALWYSDRARQERSRMHACDKNCNNMVNCFFKEEEEL